MKISKAQKKHRIEWQKAGNARHYALPYKRLYGRLKYDAERRGIPVNLTYEQYLEYTKEKHCHYCGQELRWVPHGTGGVSINIDRKNNDLGYSKRNCVASCPRCNQSKRELFSYKEWYAMTEVLRKK